MSLNTKRIAQVASLDKKAELVLKNGFVVDVIGHKTYVADVAICGDTIAGIGQYKGKQEIDCSGKYILPSFVDCNCLLDTSGLRPSHYVSAIVRHGTTTIHVEPRLIANVASRDGLEFVVDELSVQPIDFDVKVPFCVPSSEYESVNGGISSKQIGKLLKRDDYIGLGAISNVASVCSLDNVAIDKIELCKYSDKLLEGDISSGESSSQDISAYLSIGTRLCNVVSAEQATRCIQSGVYVPITCGQSMNNISAISRTVDAHNYRRYVMASADKLASDIVAKGHINDNIRQCVASGIDVFDAIAMATINAAECYGRTDVGLIGSGYLANIAVVDNLTSFNVLVTICSGEVVYRDGQINYVPKVRKTDGLGNINAKPVLSTAFNFDTSSLKLRDKSVNANVIVLGSNNETSLQTIKLSLQDNGDVQLQDDICKVAVIERYDATGRVGLGLVQGFGLRTGALAHSVARDSGNIIVVGTNTIDIVTAVDTVMKTGGIAFVDEGMIKEHFILPLAGIMSDMDANYVASRQAALVVKLQDYFVGREYPEILLSMLACTSKGKYRITDSGVVDILKQKLIKVLER